MPVGKPLRQGHELSHSEWVQQEAPDYHRQPGARIGAVDALAEWRLVPLGMGPAHGLHPLVVPDLRKRALPEVAHGASFIKDPGSRVHIPVGFDKHGAIPQPGARISPGRTRTRFLDLDGLHADNVLLYTNRIHAGHSPPLAVEVP